MLVLTRKPGEAIICELPGVGKVRVEVVRIQPGGKVQLGIEADRSVVINRDELIGTDREFRDERR